MRPSNRDKIIDGLEGLEADIDDLNQELVECRQEIRRLEKELADALAEGG